MSGQAAGIRGQPGLEAATAAALHRP